MSTIWYLFLLIQVENSLQCSPFVILVLQHMASLLEVPNLILFQQQQQQQQQQLKKLGIIMFAT